MKLQAARGDSLGELEPTDANELTTALNNAIAAEDYALATTLRDRLVQLSGGDAGPPADWQNLDIPTWLADRAEHIGYRFPTGAALFSFCCHHLRTCHHLVSLHTCVTPSAEINDC